jgi:hypothetical protein
VQIKLLQSYSKEFKLRKKCFNTPAIPGTVLKKPAEDGKVLDGEDQTILRSGIGKSMYHMQYLRPYIAQAVRDLVRHMTRGDETHMAVMLRCMQYLMCTKDAGLLLRPIRKWDVTKRFQFKMRGRLDSDYAKDTQTRQSDSVYVIYLEEAPVMHRSAMQKTVALLSCEAELNAAVVCVQDMLYAKNLLESIGLNAELPMVLEMNNIGAVDLINSLTVGGHTCHINVKQCFL